MEITTELLGTAAVGAVIILGAIGRYFSGLRQPAGVDADLRGIGLGWGEKEQMERLISAVNRIADGIENKNRAGIEGSLKKLAEDVDELRNRRARPARD